jgi:hypothetical protein
MIEIKIPKGEFVGDFISELDRACEKYNLRVHVTITDTMIVDAGYITVEGKLAIEGV